MRRIFLISAGIFAPRPRHPLRRIDQALAVGIVAGPADQGPDCFRHFVGHRNLGRSLDQVPVFGTACHFESSWAMSPATAATWFLISGTAVISQNAPLVIGPSAQARCAPAILDRASTSIPKSRRSGRASP